MREDEIYIQHIHDAISDILDYCSQGKDAFFADKMCQHAIIRNFEIIGEAASQVSEDFKARYPEIPWQVIKDFRNHLIHEYFNVDLEIVWRVVNDKLPDLKQKIEKLLP